MQVFTKFMVMLCCTVVSLTSSAEVFVSPKMSTDAITQDYVLPPGKYLVINLPGKGEIDDSYKISVNALNAVYKDVTAFLVDESNLALFKQGQMYRGVGLQKGIAPFVIEGSTQTSGAHYLILDNSYAAFISKKLQVSIQAQFTLSDIEQKKIKDIFSNSYLSLKSQYLFPDFNIHVEPCGQVNAFSESFGSGDIHYCMEMISHVMQTNNQGAFFAIFLHEVGHTLLGLWGIPGNNNEDIADEFSTYSLMSSGPSGYALLDRSLEFWQGRDSNAEAMNMLKSGDRHSLSIQRMRNIKENMQRGVDFIKRWNQLLYLHETPEALNKIINNPQYGDDVVLARNILSQRGAIASQP